MRLDALLPDMDVLRIGEVQIQPGRVTMGVFSTAPSAACPACGHLARRVHSHYIRLLKDLPWHGAPVTLRLRTRRFFCDNRGCRRGIFTERLDRVVRAYGRMTDRLDDALAAIGMTCGGEGGARLADRLGMGTSPDHLLDTLRRQPEAPANTPRVLGVDDWAFRRGHRYGTILCDLEKHRRVDLLPKRTADSLAGWLRQHPGVEVISRDRSDAYAQGASAGAPQAEQVADRWHLMHNVHDALMRVAGRCHREVAEAAKAAVPRESLPRPPSLGSSQPADRVVQPPSRAELAKQTRRARRLATYEKVVELHRQGRSQRDIAHQLDLARDVVRRFVRAGSFPERAQTLKPSAVDAHVEYLRRRWAEGRRNAKTLTRELEGQGAKVSYFSVRRLVGHWRGSTSEGAGSGPVPTPAAAGAPSANRVAWLLQRSAADLDSEEHELVQQVRALSPDLRNGADLANEFASLFHEHRADDLEAWLALASAHPAPPELSAFAQSLLKDYAAVKAAVSSRWSNGQVEGQVNRLKLIKRQMYGRAGFDLLRRRVLAAG